MCLTFYEDRVTASRMFSLNLLKFVLEITETTEDLIRSFASHSKYNL